MNTDWSDFSSVFEAVKNDGRALRFADASLQKNHEIVFEAVKRDAWALQSADASLQKNHEIVFEAVKNYGRALQWADESLKDDEYFLSMLLNRGFSFDFLNEYSSERIRKTYDQEKLRNVNSLLIKG